MFTTLTYARDFSWSPLQISRAIGAYRDWCRRRGIQCRAVWSFEYGSERGRPHYHVLHWVPGKHLVPQWDLRGWWPHGMSQTVKVLRDAVGYVAHYEAGDQGECAPGWDTKGARTYGLVGLGVEGRRFVRWWLLPQWLQELTTPEDPPRRRGCGFWLVNGRLCRGPWEFAGFADGKVVLRRVGLWVLKRVPLRMKPGAVDPYTVACNVPYPLDLSCGPLKQR